MDYPFFVRDVCLLSLELVDELEQHAQALAYQPHPAFKGQTVLTNREQLIPHDLLKRVIASLPEELRSCSGYELNCLEPGSEVSEHSDIGSMKPGIAFATAHRHKIHIPLATNELCHTLHRRSKHAAKRSQAMQRGVAYLYNDYVWHAVSNYGDKRRIHLLMSFPDLDWSIKDKMLAAFQGGQRYEEDDGLPIFHRTSL